MAAKTVTTVTGELPGSELGIVLPHEHLHMVFDVAACDPPLHVPSWPSSASPLGGKDLFTLPNLGLLRQYPYSVPYNLKLDDLDSKSVMVDELLRFKILSALHGAPTRVFGATIVENTTHGLNRNLPFLRELSLASGVHIVGGTGYYVAGAQNTATLQLGVEEMHDIMIRELVEGAEGIRCGVIGEIGSSWPIEPFEKRAIEAVALVQQATRKPVTFHPGRDPQAPAEIIRLFAEAGGDPKAQVVMSHLDRTLQDKEALLQFAELGTFTQFDLFGTECSWYQIQESIDMPSDAERVRRLGWLRDEGRRGQILVSHDLHTKHRLANFGGHGYGHILQNVVPKLRVKGWEEAELEEILVQNPRRWLSHNSELFE